MTYVLGKKSLFELAHDGLEVHPALVAMVKRAITTTPVDFSVHDGLRTVEEQRELLRTGASKTLNSYHIPGTFRPRGIKTAYGHAVDLVPYVNGKLRWEWPLIYPIAEAMYDALLLINLSDRVRWGGVWDRTLGELDRFALEDEVQAYVARRRSQGKRAFPDGPHFQIEVHV